MDETPKERAGILVVDDERGMRDLLSSELGAHGYRVSVAADGREAVEKIRVGKFEVVISDISMPNMGGLDLLAEIKRTAPGVEVILSTGYGTVETAVAAMRLGAYDFIQKPFNLAEMLALVEKALEKGEARAMLALYKSSRAVFSSLKLDSLLPLVSRLTAQILNADHATVLLAGPEGRLSVAADAGDFDAELRRVCLAAGERTLAGVEAGPVVLPLFGRAGGVIACTLSAADKKLGVLLACRSRPGALFSDADLRLATIFGAQIAQAVGNAMLYGELEESLRRNREMQGRLVQSEKLAALGQLAAGVAHEINNPLSSVMGFSQLVIQAGGLSPVQEDDLRSVLREAGRCREIVKGLLQFGRKREPRKERVLLPPLLDATLQLARHPLRLAGVEVVKSIPADLPPIMADPAQLQQVFLNLVTNARQAMEGRSGARLTIAARRDGGSVVLIFSDNGPGISPENLDRIFDPFFTTKPEGQGTGLGLSISHALVAQNGGTLEAASVPGEGAAFTLAFAAGVP
ncbi:MAG: response regulator [Elusimicrobia bacterium]|nr:response regulator [Elusimicrobiota bacterium]